MSGRETAETADLRSYLQMLSRRRLVIAVVTLVFVGASLAYSFSQEPVYDATATVLLPQQQAASALNVQSNQVPAANSLQRSLADEQQFAQGDSVKRAARHVLGYPAAISVGSSSSADVLTFKGMSGDPTRAAAIANAYANAYIGARRANQVAQYTQQVTALETSIANLQAKASLTPATSPERYALQQSIATLTQTVEQTQAASELANQIGPTVVDAARVPTAPASPKPLRNGLLGLLVGVLIAIGLAFLVDRLDDSINSREAVEQSTEGLPVVGLIPLVDSWRRRTNPHLALIEDPTSNVAESYRTLRTSVQFLGLDKPHRILGITSSVPQEGKTTTVANLAVSFARAGQRVVVVSCDLRRPRIHDFFGVSNKVGLTSVLLGQSTLNEALVQVGDEADLSILPSGPIPPNPAEILSLEQVQEVIAQLARAADLVLLDCPPVLPVTDSLLLSRLADGMLVVVGAKTTSRRDLHRTVELLQQVQAFMLGTILNRVPLDKGYSYGYGSGYYGGSRYAVETASTSDAIESEDGTPPTLAPSKRSAASAESSTKTP